MVHVLLEAIARLLADKTHDLTEKEKEIDAMYSMFHRDSKFFRSASDEDVLLYLADSEEDYLQRVELMAEIMYADSAIRMSDDNVKHELERKSLSLYTYVDERSEDFSFKRDERISQLKRCCAASS